MHEYIVIVYVQVCARANFDLIFFKNIKLLFNGVLKKCILIYSLKKLVNRNCTYSD